MLDASTDFFYLLDYRIVNINWVFLPLLGAVSGWLSIVIAFKLLLYPSFPVTFGKLNFQGVIPKHLNEVAQRLAKLLARESTISDSISVLMKSETFHQEASQLIDKRLDVLVSALKQQIPMGEMFLTGALTDKLKLQTKNEFLKMLPEMADCMVSRLSEQHSFDDSLQRQLATVDPEDLIKELTPIFQADLTRISFLGALVGALIGGVFALIILVI